MPNRTSSKKRLKQSVAKRAQNRSVKSSIRTQVGRVRSAIAAGDAEAGATEFRLAAQKLDKAASKNILHKNAAARTKSRLSAAVKAISAG